MDSLTPTEYERAVLERFKTDWPPPEFELQHDIRLHGQKSNSKRQIDVGIFKCGQPRPFMIVEVKRYTRVIDVGKVGATIALVQDIGGIPTVMVSTSGFSVAAKNHLEAEEVGHLTITLKEALGLRWIPLLERRFAVDGAFRRVSGDLVEALRKGDADALLDSETPYEEWLAVMACGQSLFPSRTTEVLRVLVRQHHDDGARYNSALLLNAAGKLRPTDLKVALQRETDPDAREALLALRG